uniref:Uncharacterized protein n=1 Tax=Proteus mirabilis TaxID=584 RepID=A0A411AMP9_PROMI|nr:hypothetical protein 1_SGI1-O_006 [Proteus mirabilis]QAX89173.1 hypothetical protein SGI1-PmCA14_006 [Proteus mirabilis]QAX89265.1 hypothetical protein SGI1-PmCA46_006 [Proteus mirabilis]QAX89523.1 hypothetical protein SGI1-Z_006 [Proteus mirabilis]
MVKHRSEATNLVMMGGIVDIAFLQLFSLDNAMSLSHKN